MAIIVAAPIGIRAESEPWARYALVIGYNDSDDIDLAPLRYADDDAVKHAQLLSVMTERTVLLTALDEDSRRAFPRVKSRRPTRRAVMSSLKSLRADMAAARAAGKRPVLYFVYSGHGNYDMEGRGYVHLADGRLTTRDLYYDVLGPTSGSNPHHLVLMVDACNAALLVNSRGSDRRRVRGSTLKLENYPNVGVVLSASSVGEVHEWGKLLSGIFSHELRSAMMGAADLNDDQRVSFPELAAFVASANKAVLNEVYRIKPYIRPPLSAPNMPLASLADSRFPVRLRVTGALAGKTHLVNDELIRYADFHKARGHEFWLGLPSARGFVLVNGNREYVVRPGRRGDVSLALAETRERTVISKRGAHEYFEKRLFASAHAPADARRWLKENYRATLTVERVTQVPWYENMGAWSLLSTSLAAVAAGGALHALAQGDLSELERNKQSLFYDEASARLGDATLRRNVGIALYSLGAAGALSSALWFALERRYTRTNYTPPLDIEVSPAGVNLRSRF